MPPIDQMHEQQNKLVKYDVGAIGLTKNSLALQGWIDCDPQVSKLVKESQETKQNFLEFAARSLVLYLFTIKVIIIVVLSVM